MFALDMTRQAMLAEIGVDDADGGRGPAALRDPADRRFVDDPEAHLVVHGPTPDDLLPMLAAVLAQRFADAPARHLIKGLLEPLKKGVGNAYKWGNRKDESRHVTVEVIATALGAVVAVTDQGKGFDVEACLGDYLKGEKYFNHGGSGMARFAESPSLVSYADGGRTLLVRFLAVPEPGRPLDDDERAPWGRAADPAAIAPLLAASLPRICRGDALLEQCRVAAPLRQPSESPQIHYRLQCLRLETGRRVQLDLTGVMSGGAPAAEIRAVTGQLHVRMPGGPESLGVPEPVAALDDPPVVVFRFSPRANLETCLKEASDPCLLEQHAVSVASFLRALHESGIAVALTETWDQAVDRYRRVAQEVAEVVAESDRRRRRAEAIVDTLGRPRAALGAPATSCPVHGNFGFKQIVQSDGRFHVTDWDHCRRSHPGFDVGGFLADVHRFVGRKNKADRVRLADVRERFLAAYGGERPPAWLEDAPFFEACGLVMRMQRLLKRPKSKWKKKIDGLLDTATDLLAELEPA